MRISELSGRSGVPIPTIKYYLREGLLPAGELTGATQARYDEGHVNRLLLIRALAEVGELSLASIRRILDAVDDDTISVHALMGVAQYALGPAAAAPADDGEWDATRAEVDDFLDATGWRITPEAPARAQLTQALVALRQLGFHRALDDLEPYAEAVRSLAAQEVAMLPSSLPREDTVLRVVVMTVLYEPVLLAFRRLAQEHESAKLYAG